MSTQTKVPERQAMLEIAAAIAPTWERRRSDVEEVSTPVRQWLVRELRPEVGDTVLLDSMNTRDVGSTADAAPFNSN